MTDRDPSEPLRYLTAQFLAWLADAPRSYVEVKEAWRTSCPRLSVWEDATIAGYVRLDGAKRTMVVLTEAGRARLAESRQGDPQPEPAEEMAARKQQLACVYAELRTYQALRMLEQKRLVEKLADELRGTNAQLKVEIAEHQRAPAMADARMRGCAT